MDWDKVRIFHAVAEAGSFTRAGEELNLSQSAVSRQISALEEALKVPLFHRHARGLVLTEQGEILYRAAHDMANGMANIATMLTDSREKPSGELRITATVGLGSAWLTPRLKDFVELYPDINVRLMLQDEDLDLTMRQADVAIWLHQPVQPELIQRRLFTAHFHVYGAPEYLRRYGHPMSVEELDEHRVITFGMPVPTHLEEINLIETAGRPPGSPREAALRVNNAYALRRAVEAGVGLAILPDYLVPDNSGLQQVLPNSLIPEFDAYLAYPEEMRDSKRLTVFRDFIVAKARTWSF